MRIHICDAIYSICASLDRNSSLLQDVGLEFPTGPINCLLPLKGMRGADVIGHYGSLDVYGFLPPIMYSIGPGQTLLYALVSI